MKNKMNWIKINLPIINFPDHTHLAQEQWLLLITYYSEPSLYIVRDLNLFLSD